MVVEASALTEKRAAGTDPGPDSLVRGEWHNSHGMNIEEPVVGIFDHDEALGQPQFETESDPPNDPHRNTGTSGQSSVSLQLRIEWCASRARQTIMTTVDGDPSFD